MPYLEIKFFENSSLKIPETELLGPERVKFQFQKVSFKQKWN